MGSGDMNGGQIAEFLNFSRSSPGFHGAVWIRFHEAAKTYLIGIKDGKSSGEHAQRTQNRNLFLGNPLSGTGNL